MILVAMCVVSHCDQSAICRVTAELASIFPHGLETSIAICRVSRYFFTIFIVDEILSIAHHYQKKNIFNYFIYVAWWFFPMVV